MNFDYLKNNNFTPRFVARLANAQFELEPISVLGNRFVEISPLPSEVVGSAKTIHFLINEDGNFGSFDALKKLLSIPVGAAAESTQFADFISDFSIKAIDYSDDTLVYEELSAAEKNINMMGGAYFSQYSRTGAGNGTVVDYDSTESNPDAWTVTFLSPTTFSVVGAVTGGFGGGDIGAVYNNPHISFTINAGATPFIPGDTFVFKINHRAINKAAELIVDLNIEIGNKTLKIQGCTNFEVINFVSGFNPFDQAQSVLSPKQKLDNLKNMVMHQVTCTYSNLIIT